ncbi:MAG: FixH family protein, partial [Calditrichia bacterium]
NDTGNRLFLHFPKEFLGKTTKGTITLYRPSDALMDRSFPIAIGDSGTQVIETPGLARGLWRVKISCSADSVEYYHEEAVVF